MNEKTDQMNWKDMFPKENRYFETENGILYNAEAIETMSKFPQQIFDAIITDPPYGTIACKWDRVILFDDMWRELKRVRKDRTPIVLFGSEPFSSLLRVSNLKEYKYDWIWKKNIATLFQHANKMPLCEYELISVFYKKQPTYNPQGIKPYNKINHRGSMGNNLAHGTKNVYIQKYTNYPKRILEFSKDKPSLHSTQKPLALMEYLIKTYTNEGDLVLDFTCGSGTTLVACEKLNRKRIGIELEEKYCEIEKKRIQDTIKEWKEA